MSGAVSSAVARYADGTAAQIGDRVRIEHGRTAGIVELVIVAPDQIAEWGVGKPGLMLLSEPFGRVFWSLDNAQDPVTLSSAAFRLQADIRASDTSVLHCCLSPSQEPAMPIPTTTIRLPDELKTRVARLAEAEGVSTHSLILDAIAEKVEAMERRQTFHAEATQRLQRMEETGIGIEWGDMKRYLRSCVAGENAQPPRPKKLRN